MLAADERMVIPAGKVVKLIVTADDVIHSFSVPAFWTKIDATPGRLNETWVKIDGPASISANAANCAERAMAICRSMSRS